jgi:hypothetical protein
VLTTTWRPRPDAPSPYFLEHDNAVREANRRALTTGRRHRVHGLRTLTGCRAWHVCEVGNCWRVRLYGGRS